MSSAKRDSFNCDLLIENFLDLQSAAHSPYFYFVGRSGGAVEMISGEKIVSSAKWERQDFQLQLLPALSIWLKCL